MRLARRLVPFVVTGMTAAFVLLVAQTAIGQPTTIVTPVEGSDDVVCNDQAFSTSSTGWVDLPAASVPYQIQNDAGTSGPLFKVTFSAESDCTGRHGTCSVRILVGDQEAQPAVGKDFAFDSSDGRAKKTPAGHSMERSRCMINDPVAQDATVRVQVSTSHRNTRFTLDDWHLTIENQGNGLLACPAP